MRKPAAATWPATNRAVLLRLTKMSTRGGLRCPAPAACAPGRVGRGQAGARACGERRRAHKGVAAEFRGTGARAWICARCFSSLAGFLCSAHTWTACGARARTWAHTALCAAETPHHLLTYTHQPCGRQARGPRLHDGAADRVGARRGAQAARALQPARGRRAQRRRHRGRPQLHLRPPKRRARARARARARRRQVRGGVAAGGQEQRAQALQLRLQPQRQHLVRLVQHHVRDAACACARRSP